LNPLRGSTLSTSAGRHPRDESYDESYSGGIEKVELVVQRFHEPLAYVLCSSMSWDAASRIGEHPGISVHEWRPDQLRRASPHPNRNKAFRQAVVALGHSMP
jgi:hypothetical protein